MLLWSTNLEHGASSATNSQLPEDVKVAARTSFPHRGVVKVEWDALSSGAKDGSITSIPKHIYKTVQFYGTFAGTTVKMLGSMTTVTGDFVVLADADGADISLTSGGIRVIRAHPEYLMPSITATATGAGYSINVELIGNV